MDLLVLFAFVRGDCLHFGWVFGEVGASVCCDSCGSLGFFLVAFEMWLFLS